VILRVGAKTFGGKVHPSLELRVFRHLLSRFDAPCSSILYGYSHLPWAKIWESLGVPRPSSLTRIHRKAPLPEGIPLDLRVRHGKIGIILRCNPWAVCWLPEGTFYGFCMGKIGQNLKIGKLWPLVAPQPYVVEKIWPISETPWPLDYNVEWTVSLQCTPWLVTCSEWGACLIFEFRFWQQMTPKVKMFENIFPDSSTGHTFHGQIWWKSAVAKLPKGRVDYHTQKLGLRGTCSSPHFAQNGPIAPKIPWTLSPLDVSMSTEFGPDMLRVVGLIPERLIFRPQK